MRTIWKAAVLWCGCLGLMGSICAQRHRLEKLWETEALLKVPESVLPDPKGQVMYVSNIDGLDPWARDGKGSIAILGLDGKVINAEWVRGLLSPKGMALYKGTLYVADLNELVLIDIEKGEIRKKIPVPQAERLNDITIDPKGVGYVSDTRGNRIYTFRGNDATPFVEGLQGPNGVSWIKDNLFFVDKTGLSRVEYDRKLTRISEGFEGGPDGVQAAANGAFLVSCWAGVIYYIYADGTKEVLSDTRNEKINSADIFLDSASGILYVPEFWKNRVTAYRLY